MVWYSNKAMMVKYKAEIKNTESLSKQILEMQLEFVGTFLFSIVFFMSPSKWKTIMFCYVRYDHTATL